MSKTKFYQEYTYFVPHIRYFLVSINKGELEIEGSI